MNETLYSKYSLLFSKKSNFYELLLRYSGIGVLLCRVCCVGRRCGQPAYLETETAPKLQSRCSGRAGEAGVGLSGLEM